MPGLSCPPNFDPNKKYPALVYIYDGPHVQMVTNSWLNGGELWMHRMAELGVAVFVLDGRQFRKPGIRFRIGHFPALRRRRGGRPAPGGRRLPEKPALHRFHTPRCVRMGLWRLHGHLAHDPPGGQRRVPLRRGRRPGDRLAHVRDHVHRALHGQSAGKPEGYKRPVCSITSTT